jgi:hypothetical protein
MGAVGMVGCCVHTDAQAVDVADMKGRGNRLLLLLFVVVCLGGAGVFFGKPLVMRTGGKILRTAILHELRPVSLTNCTFARIGGLFDGGYLMCENLLADIKSAYSYGIRTDRWGCAIATKHKVPLYQYDCFDPTRPVCPGAVAESLFRDECIGGAKAQIEGRFFDTLANQVSANGDTNRKIVVKMDVEGAELESLANTSDHSLQNLDQLAVEFHLTPGTLWNWFQLIRKLKRNFYIVNVHFNNHSCITNFQPIPAWAFQVSFVNKRLGQLSPVTRQDALDNPLNKPDRVGTPDCQHTW